MFFSGLPACAVTNSAGQGTSTPQLLAAKATVRTPMPSKASRQSPREPVRGQLAPPRAKSTTGADTTLPEWLFSRTATNYSPLVPAVAVIATVASAAIVALVALAWRALGPRAPA